MITGGTLSPKTAEIIAWLQFCFAMLERGTEELMPYDPFYRSPRNKNGFLTDGYSDRLVKLLDREFEYELKHSATYHSRNAGGQIEPPEFSRLSVQGRRALAQGIDRILAKYR